MPRSITLSPLTLKVYVLPLYWSLPSPHETPTPMATDLLSIDTVPEGFSSAAARPLTHTNAATTTQIHARLIALSSRGWKNLLPMECNTRQGIVPSMTTLPLALDGIRVIDLSRVIAGPWCGALLADLGADVIKVEDPGGGDESRTWPPHKDGEAAAYLLFNRNKRGLQLDLKTPEGVEVLKALVARSDVLVENFRTGTMESFGLGYETLAAINPRLIYCSVSAFGRTGPRKDSPGYEALMQAFSGIMSITGEPGGPPVRSAVSFLDLTTGILCTLGVCAAIMQRERTGLGQRVDGSLLETAVSLLAYHAEGYLLAGVVPKPLGSAHPSLSPYRTFKCKDGQWVFIAAANDRLWRRLTGALDLAWMADDPRFR